MFTTGVRIIVVHTKPDISVTVSSVAFHIYFIDAIDSDCYNRHAHQGNYIQTNAGGTHESSSVD